MVVAITILVLLAAVATYARVQEELIRKHENDDCK